MPHIVKKPTLGNKNLPINLTSSEQHSWFEKNARFHHNDHKIP